MGTAREVFNGIVGLMGISIFPSGLDGVVVILVSVVIKTYETSCLKYINFKFCTDKQING